MTTAWSSRADLVSRSLAPTIEPAGRPRIGNFCKILKADPTAQIGRRVETEHSRAVCQCGSEDVYEEPADRRVRLDRYDPATSATRASASTVTRAILLSSGPS
jgi:hypothetical protein